MAALVKGSKGTQDGGGGGGGGGWRGGEAETRGERGPAWPKDQRQAGKGKASGAEGQGTGESGAERS
jgi:hypothetical protein